MQLAYAQANHLDVRNRKNHGNHMDIMDIPEGRESTGPIEIFPPFGQVPTAPTVPT